MNKVTKRVAILTSGGDAPGMNAAIRAFVIAATKQNFECVGYTHGYNGLINQESIILTKSHAQDIIHLGGTILKSARCAEMKSLTGLKQAVNTLVKDKIDALVVIGGDGSFKGLTAIKKHWSGQIIGIPGTIDNDLALTDSTIGFDTATDTAINAIDKIRDTANAFDRVFVVELMGRHSGHLTFNVGLAVGAECIISFENCPSEKQAIFLQELITDIVIKKADTSSSYLICVAENLWNGGTTVLIESLKQANIDSALCILGHIQRGGNPTANDRLLANKMAIAALDLLLTGQTMKMVSIQNNEIVGVDIIAALTQKKPTNAKTIEQYQLLKV